MRVRYFSLQNFIITTFQVFRSFLVDEVIQKLIKLQRSCRLPVEELWLLEFYVASLKNSHQIAVQKTAVWLYCITYVDFIFLEAEAKGCIEN